MDQQGDQLEAEVNRQEKTWLYLIAALMAVMILGVMLGEKP